MVKFICDISRRLLALLLISSLIMAVSATGTAPGAYSPTGGESNGRAIVPPEDWVTGEGTLLFSMSASQVTTFLHSNGSFIPENLGSNVESIYFSGNVYSSNVANGGNCRVYVGIGYKSWRSGDFIEKYSIEILKEDNGIYFGSDQTRRDISEFNSSTRYYAFIRNDHPTGGSVYVWGNVYVYSSTLPA